MLRQSLNFSSLLTVYLNKPKEPLKPVPAELQFNECEEKCIKASLVIKGRSLPLVWSLEYNDFAPKFPFPWVSPEVKDPQASKVLAKSAIDKFSKTCLTRNQLTLLLKPEGSAGAIVVPQKVNGKLTNGFLINDDSLEALTFVFAHGCLRQLHYLAHKLNTEQPKLSDQAFLDILSDWYDTRKADSVAKR